uniref:restriction endonuclease subunit S n=1 Tax=Ellagibacter isourolithinifaciens TaxID=2137581 RepID=UPI003AB0D46A
KPGAAPARARPAGRNRGPNRNEIRRFCRTNRKRCVYLCTLRWPLQPTFGIPSLVKDQKPFVFQRHVAILRPNDRIEPEYLYYSMKSRNFYHWADSVAIGAAQRTVTLGQLREKTIALPPLPVQSRIAGVLSAYDKLIENNRRQIKLLEEAAQRLYKEWFVDLRFPGHETTPIHNGVPEGWKRTTVGQSSSLVSRGVTPAYADDSNELVLGQRCVRNNLVDLSFARHHKPKKPNEKWLKKWDVLINSTGTGSLGRTAQFWLDNNNVVVDSHITIIRAQQREVAAYLGQWAFSNEAMLEALHTGSTGQTELPRDRVANCHILIPDNDLLDLFYTLIEPMTMRIVAAQQQIVAAREARDRLLPKLMSGEIEV